MRQQPQVMDSLVLWLHGEWLARGPRDEQSSARAYTARYQQMQQHLGGSAIPTTFVALAHNSPVGCISLTRLQAANKHFARGLWMTNLYVVPAAREQGVASALLAGAEQQALHLNEAVLYLFTDSAADFYRRRGWQQCLNSVVPKSADDRRVCVFKKHLANMGGSGGVV
ncbi:MAG: GNAT family N-acetyltransferase [Marinagarivorans sp.]|nr:GNAT family N-acetyltransferase [Marinagarivorans sp.]